MWVLFAGAQFGIVIPKAHISNCQEQIYNLSASRNKINPDPNQLQ